MKSISDKQLDELLTKAKLAGMFEQYDVDETLEHPVNDVALLEAWELGDLTDEELRDLNHHLDQCYDCRRAVAAMIKHGILEFQNPAFPPSTPQPWYDLRQAPAWIFVAASVLIAVVCVRLISFQGGTDLARNDLILKQNSLTDYDYDLRGMPLGFKGGDEPDPLAKQRFLDQMSRNPDDMQLRFDYGQWLLAEYRPTDAITEFEKIETAAPNSAAVQNALGMAWFMKETGRAEPPKIARGHFLKAVQLAPADKAINLNLAICLTVLGDDTAAKEYFEKAGVSR